MFNKGIRRRLLVSFCLMAVAVTCLALPLSDWLIGRNFSAFEIGKGRDDADRLQLLLTQKLEQISANAVDYGNWALAVDYLRSGDPEFIEENFFPDALRNFDADYVFITDSALAVRYLAGTPEYAGGANDDRMQPLAPASIAPVLNDPLIRKLASKRGDSYFIRRLGSRWYLIGASSITTPNQDQDVNGVLGFASELTPARKSALQALAQVPFELKDLSGQSEGSWLVGGDINTLRKLRDQAGQAMAVLDIQYPRPLAAQLRVARRLLLSLSIGVFIIGCLLVWLLVDRGVITRLEKMDRGLDAISRGHSASLPTSDRNDEVDHIASGFNRLYAELSSVNQIWRHEAQHDALTGLGNRAHLLRLLEGRLYGASEHAPLALLLLDLDGFKTINDIYGHAMGDRVLKRVADCLRTHLAEDHPCFRLGGDEFAVLAGGETEAEVRALAEVLNQAIRSADFGENMGTLLSVSIGVAWLQNRRSVMTPSEVMQRADIALYSIKRRNRDGYALFDDSMLHEMQQQYDIQRSLSAAIKNGEVQAWFQPIVSAVDHRVLRFEALARWKHHDIGWVEPARFVSVAEQHFIAARLDLSILRQSLAALPSICALAPDTGISVNVSAQSLLDKDYVAEVGKLLSESRLGERDLVLEVTETILAQNEEALIEPLAALSAQGVSIVLDDFGVGHSSLSRLVQIRPGGIKLDGSFVRNRSEGGDRVCRALIGFARQLEIQVTAECVETPGDAAFLKAAGCHALQGFLFSQPKPLHEIIAWLIQRKPSQRVAITSDDAGWD